MTTVDDADSRTFEAVVLLYVAAAKLPDGDLGEAEARRILELTRRHTAGLAESYGEGVIADVAERLAALTEPQDRLAAIVDAAEHLARALERSAKQGIADELRSIARVDGTVSAGERDFVEAVVQTFGVE